MNTYVFTKNQGDIANSITLVLNNTEIISDITEGQITPQDDDIPVFTILSGLNAEIEFTISGGNTNVTYGIPLTVTTNMRVLQIMMAVAVVSDSFDPYVQQDPGSYQDLIGDLEAGKSALATAVFQLPTTLDPSNGYVVWDLLDEEGFIHASGNAYEYKILSTGLANTVIGRSVINVPADIPASPTPYQLRYTLRVGGQILYSYESIQIVGFIDMQLGCTDSIEMQGDVATVSLVTEKLYSNYVMELWRDNVKIAELICANPERVSSGYFVAASIDTSGLVTTLRPYQVVWRFWSDPSQTFRELATLWIINPSIMQAIEDVKSKINKARQTLYGTADSQFPSTEIMKWLRRGMDSFNSTYGVFTSFTMVNAMGGVREYWLMYAELGAIHAQFMMEGEKAFTFSGAAISLDVDRTGFLDTMAGKIQSQLDNEFKAFKQNLVIKGNTGGDGSGPYGDGNFNVSQRGALGAVGVTLTPASLYGGLVQSFPR